MNKKTEKTIQKMKLKTLNGIDATAEFDALEDITIGAVLDDAMLEDEYTLRLEEMEEKATKELEKECSGMVPNAKIEYCLTKLKEDIKHYFNSSDKEELKQTVKRIDDILLFLRQLVYLQLENYPDIVADNTSLPFLLVEEENDTFTCPNEQVKEKYEKVLKNVEINCGYMLQYVLCNDVQGIMNSVGAFDLLQLHTTGYVVNMLG